MGRSDRRSGKVKFSHSGEFSLVGMCKLVVGVSFLADFFVLSFGRERNRMEKEYE